MSIWNKGFVLLLIINGLQSLGFQILVPNLPLYALRYTTSETLLGVLGASIAGAALATRPISALLADRGNRKFIIVVSQAAMAIVGLLLLAASSFSMLFILRLLQGMLFSIISTTVVTAGTLSIPPEKLGYGLGILTLSNIGCQAVAPALGIFIAERFGYAVLFIFIAMLSVASGLAALALSPAPARPKVTEERKKVSLRDMFAFETTDLAFVMMFFTMTTSVIVNFLLLYGTSKGLSGMGYYFTIFAAVVIVIRLLGGSIIDRFDYRSIAPVYAALCMTGLIILAFAQSFLSIAFTAILVGIGYGYANPTIQMAMVRRVPPSRVGAVTATAYVGMDAAHVISPVIMGVIVENVSYRVGFTAFCAPLAAAILILLILKKKSCNGG